jgi:hypothetical protein
MQTILNKITYLLLLRAQTQMLKLAQANVCETYEDTFAEISEDYYSFVVNASKVPPVVVP